MTESASTTDRRALHQELLDAEKPELAAMALRLDASAAAQQGEAPPMPSSLEDEIRKRYPKPEPIRRRDVVEEKTSFGAWLRDFIFSPGPAFAAVAACLVAAFFLLVPGAQDDVLRGSADEWAGAAPVVFLGIDPAAVPGLNLETSEIAKDEAAFMKRLADSASSARLAVTVNEVRGYRAGEIAPALAVPYTSIEDLPDAIVEAEEMLRAE